VSNVFQNIAEAGTQIASVSLAALAREIVLPSTVYRSADADYSGRTGDTVTVRKPASLTARVLANRDSAITIDDIEETGVPVALNTHIYSAASITDEETEFSIEDFVAQVAAPQIRAVAEMAENVLADEFNGLSGDVEVAADGSDVLAKIAEAVEGLNTANVPFQGRYLAVSPSFQTHLLKTDLLLKLNEAGSDSALRSATVGQLFGLQVVTANALDAGTAVAYHRDAFALVTRAPRVPQGVATGASQTYQGISMRWIMDYDTAYLRDRSVLSMFAGATVLDEDRAVKLTTATSLS
jgi:hypothetical protein